MKRMASSERILEVRLPGVRNLQISAASRHLSPTTGVVGLRCRDDLPSSSPRVWGTCMSPALWKCRGLYPFRHLSPTTGVVGFRCPQTDMNFPLIYLGDCPEAQDALESLAPVDQGDLPTSFISQPSEESGMRTWTFSMSRGEKKPPVFIDTGGLDLLLSA